MNTTCDVKCTDELCFYSKFENIYIYVYIYTHITAAVNCQNERDWMLILIIIV